MNIVSRDEAKLSGLKRYFTGEPCKHGHTSERLVSNGQCVECKSEAYANNPEPTRERARQWGRDNPERVRERVAKWDEENPGRANERSRQWHADNREIANERSRQWYADNTEYALERDRQYRAEHAEQIGDYFRNRLATDIMYKMRVYLRGRLNQAIKNDYKAGSSVQDLGCSIEQFKAYFEQLFKPGMTWSNWGDWHIDHIKPLSVFDLTDREQFLMACHYSNLQPLWKSENLAKGSKA